MYYSFKTLLIFIVFIASQSALGKDYIIEMIFFANMQDSSESVHISNRAVIPDLKGAMVLDESSTNGFISLDADIFQLSDKAKALNNSGNYRVLKHMAWLQPGLAKEDPVNELDGTVKIVLGRFLHLYTDLVYRKTFTISSGDALGRNRVLADFPVKSHRKMRSKTLHYVDHPYLGILIEIRPIEE